MTAYRGAVSCAVSHFQSHAIEKRYNLAIRSHNKRIRGGCHALREREHMTLQRRYVRRREANATDVAGGDVTYVRTLRTDGYVFADLHLLMVRA